MVGIGVGEMGIFQIFTPICVVGFLDDIS